MTTTTECKCRKCGILKSVTEFAVKTKNGKDYRELVCKKCRSRAQVAKRKNEKAVAEVKNAALKFVRIEGSVVEVALVTVYQCASEQDAREIASKLSDQGYKEIA